MRIFQFLRYSLWIAALCLYAQEAKPPAQEAPKEAPANEIKGLPPRIAPTDYQAHAETGDVTIAADFAEHGVPTPDAAFTTEDYVAVETALFGPQGTRVKISADDFTLRINGKKTALTSRPYGMVLANLKDPSWEPPELPSTKSKTSLTSGDSGGGDNTPPPPPHMPMPLRHAMEQKVQKAALPEGDRALPVAGLLFFSYRGQSKSIQSVELIYSGPAGKVTLKLHP
jgi:hypothetical protein